MEIRTLWSKIRSEVDEGVKDCDDEIVLKCSKDRSGFLKMVTMNLQNWEGLSSECNSHNND